MDKRYCIFMRIITILKILFLYLQGQNGLQLTFKPYLSSETQLFMHVKYYRKNVFVQNFWPANLALFIYVSTHCVGTDKWLDYNRYSQLTRWCSSNASALGARGPGFNPWLRQGYIFRFFICCFCVFPISSKSTLFITKVCISIYNVNLLSILNILQDL